MMRCVILLTLSLLLVACEAQATPISAINTPTATQETILSPIAQIRYGLYPNVQGYVQDIDMLQETAVVEPMSAENAITDYDIVVAYGVYDGWQQSPLSHHTSLVVNPNVAPLTDETIRSIVRQTIDIQQIVEAVNIPGTVSGANNAVSANETRTALANAGYPDGFVLTMAVENVQGLEAIAAQFTQANIDLHVIQYESDTLRTNRAHLILTVWTQDSERAAWIGQVGEANVLDLFTLPISYMAAEGLNITFTENGWPLPAR